MSELQPEPNENQLDGMCIHGNYFGNCAMCVEEKNQQSETRSSRGEFVDSLVDQKIGIARLLADIEKDARQQTLDENWDEYIERRLGELEISDKQSEIVRRGINEFRAKNVAIKHFIDGYQSRYGDAWKEKLFAACFNQDPIGGIDLRVGPITLYWQCSSLEDYAQAADLSVEEARQSFGFRKSPLDFHLDGLRGTIILEYTGHLENKSTSDEHQRTKSNLTEMHEEQHIIYDLFPSQLDYSALEFPGLSEQSKISDIERSIQNFLTLRRGELEESAKNEILAYWKDGEKSPAEIQKVIVEPGGMYDNSNIVSGPDIVPYLVKRFGERFRSIINSHEIDERWRAEGNTYRRHVQQAIEILNLLAAITPEKKCEYIYLLMMELLDKWPRLQRMVRDKV